MSNERIIYLLGAGASNGALPVVSEMLERLKIFYLVLFVSDIYDKQEENDSRRKELLIATKNLLLEIEDRRSIDTYAKELYIKGDITSLVNLKAVLGTYLLFEEMFSDNDIREYFSNKFQTLKQLSETNSNRINSAYFSNINIEIKNKLNQPGNSGPDYVNELNCLLYLYKINHDKNEYQNYKEVIDQRYVNFLIDVMEKQNDFPSKIKIFSWNYDSQFPLAIKSLGFKISPSSDISEYNFLKKLNGVAVRREINPALELKKLSIPGRIIECAYCFWRLTDKESKDRNLLLKFAFEQDPVNTATTISSHLEDTKTVSDLVIIGYSFPVSNRDIDKKVFEEILSKVEYTQAKIINLNIYLQVPHNQDHNNNNYLILKNKIVGIINSIKPELELSNNDNELSHIIPSGDYIYPTSLKIKFHEQWDPYNFYIPHSF